MQLLCCVVADIVARSKSRCFSGTSDLGSRGMAHDASLFETISVGSTTEDTCSRIKRSATIIMRMKFGPACCDLSPLISHATLLIDVNHWPLSFGSLGPIIADIVVSLHILPDPGEISFRRFLFCAFVVWHIS